MARGWESKDVESQVQENKHSMSPTGKVQKTEEQMAKDREIQGLQLSRKRIVADLETATHPNHKQSLEAALAHLDAKISKLK